MSFFLGADGAERWLAETLRPTLATFDAVRHDQRLTRRRCGRRSVSSNSGSARPHA
jgi:hypothetical protein